jgi:tetratricopeptide (TPR) repeat protein
MQALPAALNAALSFKKTRDWDNVTLSLEEPLKAIGNKPHPNKAAAEALLKEAAEQKERRKQFKVELERINTHIKAQNYEAARLAGEITRKLAQEPSELLALNEALRRADEGAKKIKQQQAQVFEAQGRALRPERNAKGDWSKAGEAFKSAAAIFQEIDEKDSQARALIEQAECLRKDKNKNGDWTQAANIYASAAQLYGTLGDKKAQGEVLARQASCYDPTLNPAGDWRQAATLYGRAAFYENEAGNKKGQADYLGLQASCISHEKFAGAWERAGDIYKRAGALYIELGDKKTAGVCVYNEAFSRIKGQKQNLTPEIRTLFQRAATLSREGGDETNAVRAEGWLK